MRRKASYFVLTPLAVMGFTTIVAEILLIIAYQAFNGYIYHRVALLFAAFMIGLSCGAFFGMRRKRAYLTQVMLDQVGFILLLILAFFILRIQPNEIRLTGGGSNNKEWRKICADIFDSEVVGFKVSEGAALGAAIQALWCYQKQNNNFEKISSITERLIKVDDSTRVSPTKQNVEKYKIIQKKHDALRDRLFRELII
jgi:sugar (pentulose or hexulose) kinase